MIQLLKKSNVNISRIDIISLSMLTILGAGMSIYLGVHNMVLGGDGLQYLTVVFNWFSGNGYKTVNGATMLVEPGYGILVYFVNLLVNDIEYSSIIVSICSYICLLPLIYFTILYLAGKWAAIFCTFTIAIFPYLLNYSYTNQTESCFTFFLFLTFSLFVKLILDKNSSVIWFILFGVSACYLILIRPEGWMPCCLSILVLSIFSMKKYYSNIRDIKVITKYLTMIGVILAIIIPWLLFLHSISGGMWVLSPKQIKVTSSNTHITNEDFTKDDLEETDYSYKRMLYPEKIVNQIIPFILLEFEMNSYVLVPAIIVYSVLLAMSAKKIPLIIEKVISGYNREKAIFLSFIIFISPSIAYIARRIHSRYLMPYAVFSVLLSGILIIYGIKKLFLNIDRRYISLGLIFLILCMIIILVCPFNFISRYSEVPHQTLPETLATNIIWKGVRQAGLWIYENYPNDSTRYIAADSRCNLALFYANGKNILNKGRCWAKPDMLRSWNDVDNFFAEGGDLVIFTYSTAPKNDNFSILWNEPTRADEFDLEAVHIEPDLFQIYRKASMP